MRPEIDEPERYAVGQTDRHVLALLSVTPPPTVETIASVMRLPRREIDCAIARLGRAGLVGRTPPAP